jgi:hypothetical protein
LHAHLIPRKYSSQKLKISAGVANFLAVKRLEGALRLNDNAFVGRYAADQIRIMRLHAPQDAALPE